jgi:transposase InsO family protein
MLTMTGSWEALRYAGERCGRHRVARLMRRAGLHGVPQRRQWRKKPSGVRPHGTRNHLERDFTAIAPHTKWVTDITYIRTVEHWLYRCIVLDLYSGLVVGWSMSPRLLLNQNLWVHCLWAATILNRKRQSQISPTDGWSFGKTARGWDWVLILNGSICPCSSSARP